MEDIQFAFRVSAIGISSVFLVMVILMLVLQAFGVLVRRWRRPEEGSEGKKG